MMMRRKPSIQRDRREFRSILADCLHEIYGLPFDAATKKVDALWLSVYRAVGKEHIDLFLHNDPIDLASELAGVEGRPSWVDLAQYASILERHGWGNQADREHELERTLPALPERARMAG